MNSSEDPKPPSEKKTAAGDEPQSLPAAEDPSQTTGKADQSDKGGSPAEAENGKIKQGRLARWRKNMRESWPEVRHSLKNYFLVFFFVLIFVVALLYHRIVISIYPGESGVIWKRFSEGTQLNEVYGEGIHFIWPWDKLYVYNLRVQQEPTQFYALSLDALSIYFDVSIRYRPRPDKLPVLHQEIGPDYVEKVVKPEIQAAIREIVGKFEPEEIYRSQGFIVQAIVQRARLELVTRHVILDDLLIKEIRLPTTVRQSIERKLAQQQASLEYDYRIEKEKKEAIRKYIEAQGIRAFQEEVTRGDMFEKYLAFRGIEATLELSTSPNAKVVLIGGKDGLPLILNLPDSPMDPSQVSGTKDVRNPRLLEEVDQKSKLNRSAGGESLSERIDFSQAGGLYNDRPSETSPPPDPTVREGSKDSTFTQQDSKRVAPGGQGSLIGIGEGNTLLGSIG